MGNQASQNSTSKRTATGKTLVNSSHIRQVNIKQRHLQTACTDKAIARLQRQILSEYPWLTNVYESMLITDCTLPDCPIVYANDEFEQMTLYSKEEILGRNCRFLQGRLTNRDTVRAIRRAVEMGEEMEVEILNYRRDGVPFMNNFLMLPVHKSKRSSTVTHFIAIQKDVTVFIQGGPNQRDVESWTAVEVAMWMEQVGLGEWAVSFMNQNVDGVRLLDLQEDDLILLGVMVGSDRDKLMRWIDRLSECPKAAYQLAGEGLVDMDTTDSDAASLLSDGDSQFDFSLYKSPKHELHINQEINLGNPNHLKIWQSNPKKQIVIKCYYCDKPPRQDEGDEEEEEELEKVQQLDGDPRLFLMRKRGLTLLKLRQEIARIFGSSMSISYLTQDDELVPLNSSRILKKVVSQLDGGTLRVLVRKSLTSIHGFSSILLNTLPMALLVLEGRRVVFANQEACVVLNYRLTEILFTKVKKLIPDAEKLGITGDNSSDSNQKQKGKGKAKRLSGSIPVGLLPLNCGTSDSTECRTIARTSEGEERQIVLFLNGLKFGKESSQQCLLFTLNKNPASLNSSRSERAKDEENEEAGSSSGSHIEETVTRAAKVESDHSKNEDMEDEVEAEQRDKLE